MMRILALPVIAALTALVSVSSLDAQVAVRGGIIHTVEGPPIEDGIVLIRDGRIEAVGAAADLAVPAGFRIMEAAVVTPGLVDVRGTVGLSGILNVDHDQDQLERSAPLQPELRAYDAYNAREELIDWVRELGTTTVNASPAPGALASGQGVIVKTRGATVDQAVLHADGPLAFTLGPSVGRNFDSPGTRSRGIAMLREAFLQAGEYSRGRERGGDTAPSRNLRHDALVAALNGEVPVLVTAHRATEIMAALRLADEFGFRLILDGAAEVYLVLDEVRAAGVPIALHATMLRPGGEAEHASFETAARLRAAGIPFAIQTGYEAYVPKTRVLLFEAGLAAAHGLGVEAALHAVTLAPARILGIDDRVGSIAPGKDADLVLFDGDPFEYTSRVCGVLIDGAVMSEGCR